MNPILAIPGEPISFEYEQGNAVGIQSITPGTSTIIQTRSPHCLNEGERVFVRYGGKDCNLNPCNFVSRVIDECRFEAANFHLSSDPDPLNLGYISQPVDLTGQWFKGAVASKPMRVANPPAVYGSINQGKYEILVKGSHDITTGDLITLGKALVKTKVLGVVRQSKAPEPIKDISPAPISKPTKNGCGCGPTSKSTTQESEVVVPEPEVPLSVVVVEQAAICNEREASLYREPGVIVDISVNVVDPLCGVLECEVDFSQLNIPPCISCNEPFKLGCYQIYHYTGYQSTYPGQPTGAFVATARLFASGDFYVLPTLFNYQ